MTTTTGPAYEPLAPLADLMPDATAEQMTAFAEAHDLELMVDYAGRLALPLAEAYRAGEILAEVRAAEAAAKAKADADRAEQARKTFEASPAGRIHRINAADRRRKQALAELTRELEGPDWQESAAWKAWEAKADAAAAELFAVPTPEPTAPFKSVAEILAEKTGKASDGLNYNAPPPPAALGVRG
ncbi:MAG TPA: hypothetical protein VIP58_10330 [Nocardioides sp.]